MIPALILKCWEAKETNAPEIVAWGSGTATREFLYVEAAAEAVVLAAGKYHGADFVNLGPGEEISIRELLDLVRTLVGYKGAVRWDNTNPDGRRAAA